MPTFRSTIAAAAQRATGSRETGPSFADTAPPVASSEDYDETLAAAAASVLYLSPLPSPEGRPIYVLNSAAFPDANKIDYNSLLAYVLARLPGEEELIAGAEYELIFLAGGQLEGATAEKKQGPDRGWYIQAYHVLSRATRKKLKKLYILHTRSWVRVLVILLSQIASRKFSRKIDNVSTLSMLALHLPLEQLLLPPSAYLQDRRVAGDIYAPYATGRRAFNARHPLPRNLETGERRLPRVLRETTTFLCMPAMLKTEGLFRIPPHATLASVLKESYDRGQQFIIWKELDCLFVQPGTPQHVIDEAQAEDAYGVHLAASLIKTWYRELREPIFSVNSYAALQDAYADPTAAISTQQLIELFAPQSNASPLSAISREILTRHLFPMLFLVHSQEDANRMSSEALAVCFGMCLLCGPDQMQDARMIPIVKRILRAAIEKWPKLRANLDIQESTFFSDIAPPAAHADYEDPLDGLNTAETGSGHAFPNRIELRDDDLGSNEMNLERSPTLPPRRRSPHQDMPKTSTTLPVPESISTVPERKPVASPVVESTQQVIDPPRYSSIFDADGTSVHTAESPSVYGPADGFRPFRSDTQPSRSFVDNKEKWTSSEQSKSSVPSIVVPKRKVVGASSGAESDRMNPAPVMSFAAHRTVPNDVLAQIVAQQAAASNAQRRASESAESASDDRVSIALKPEPFADSRNGETIDAPVPVFRKPSWPASANVPLAIHSLARPVLPVRKSQTVPGMPASTPLASGNPNNMIRMRAPSPGLLKRMNSIEPPEETTKQGSSTLEPRKLNLKKASVDDLRRLYEDRVNTARSMVGNGSGGSAGSPGSNGSKP